MEKWKSLLKQAQAAAKAAQDIAAKGTGPDGAMTEAERTEFQGKHDEALRLKGESDQAKKDADSQALLKDLASVDGDAPDDGAPAPKASGWEVSDRGDMADIRSFGEKFVKSAAYGEFRKEFPNGVGRGTPVSIGRVKVGERGTFAQTRLKTLTFGQAHTQPVRFPTIDLVDRDRLTLLDLIDHGQTDGDFEYVQVTGVTRNAKIVGELTSESLEADLKPVSDMTTQLADAKVYTYADGYDVTNKLLANAPAFATYMNNELKYSLDNLIEDKLLNGTGTNGEPLGILSTTGVQQVEYTAEAVGSDGMPTEATAKAFIRAIRMAILQITRLPGGTVTGIVMSPEMDAAMDLLQDLEAGTSPVARSARARPPCGVAPASPRSAWSTPTRSWATGSRSRCSTTRVSRSWCSTSTRTTHSGTSTTSAASSRRPRQSGSRTASPWSSPPSPRDDDD